MEETPLHDTSGDARAAVAAEVALRLRQAARTLRLWGGGLRYHPATGQRPQPGPEFLEALSMVEVLVRQIQQGAAERGLEEATLVAASGPAAEPLHVGHAAVDRGAQAVLAAVEALRATVGTSAGPSEGPPDGASMDAPYGSGAPRRHHPGALSTIVAERIEGLALALEAVTILKANLARAGRRS